MRATKLEQKISIDDKNIAAATKPICFCALTSARRRCWDLNIKYTNLKIHRIIVVVVVVVQPPPYTQHHKEMDANTIYARWEWRKKKSMLFIRKITVFIYIRWRASSNSSLVIYYLKNIRWALCANGSVLNLL